MHVRSEYPALPGGDSVSTHSTDITTRSPNTVANESKAPHTTPRTASARFPVDFISPADGDAALLEMNESCLVPLAEGCSGPGVEFTPSTRRATITCNSMQHTVVLDCGAEVGNGDHEWCTYSSVDLFLTGSW